MLTLTNREWGRRHWLTHVFRRNTRLPEIGPIVTFTFDDFARTAYTAGGAILKNSGVRGTYYAALGLMNTITCSGIQFGLEDLHAVVADGHELASHTYRHVSSRGTSVDEFVEDVLRGRAAMKSIPGLDVSDNFAYPFGAVTVAAKLAVGKRMLSCRGSYQGINRLTLDLNLLRANSLYGGMERLEFVRRLIRMNRELSGWLIFYTHDIRSNPSRWGCTAALLESAVKLALDSSMKILTVNEVLRHLQSKTAVN